MLLLTIISAIILMISIVLAFLSMIIAEKTFWDREKASPFECGFEPLSPNRVPFSLRFFMIAVIFLVFDVEIVLLLPLSFMWELTLISFWSFTYFLFLIILLLGTMYEWTYGALYWMS